MKITATLSFSLLVCGSQPFGSSALLIEDVDIAGDIEVVGDSFLSQGAAKGSSQANVDSSFVSFVQTKARGETVGPFGINPSSGQNKHFLPVTSVFHTTQEHVDYDAHSNYQMQAEGLVALYSLDDHEGAHFEVEETCIPIQKNRLMLFAGGDSVHRTVIRNAGKNAIKFIGPFATKTLAAVGIGPPPPGTPPPTASPSASPTASPTTYPTASPTTSPTASPSKSPTTAKSGKKTKAAKKA